MQTVMRLAGLVVVITIGTGELCMGQSLAAVAREEQERRKKISSPGKEYTNEDLRGAGVATLPSGPATNGPPAGMPQGAGAPRPPASTARDTSDSSPTADSGGAPDAEAAPEGGEAPTRTEASWRNRVTTARDELERLQLFLDSLQSRVNGLWADFTARDDPAERATLEQDRQRALAEMERVRSDIEEKTQEIADIEEEARRTGVPPGWLR